ncbi:MAG: NHL repeat-containing protein, partial [Anaerolineaceae bacterium]|nr:NHL repeat-containing protein [Anaerolineaceae bacterium]
KPTRDLQEVPLIISGDSTAGKMQPIVQDRYIEFETMRLWWPNQDYYNLTWQRIWDAVSNPKMRAAIYKIWLNRDYSLYATLTNNPNLKPETWQPSSKMRFYIRKDVAAKIWNYGVAPAAQELTMTDPYEAAITAMEPGLVIGGPGGDPGLFQSPRGLAAAPDGSIYVADSRNHRVQRFSADGELMSTWGRYADATQPNSDAPGGTFNEPWGIAVAADGSVYVADTWNYRIQKFNANGEFVTMWGFLGTAESGNAFWGPRDVAVDSQGRVYVSDTGNKRMAIFNPSGEYITQFGSAGVELGQFDEPVGIAIDLLDNLFVVDTWNERVQGFSPTGDDLSFVPFTSWEIYGWFGLSLENKPYRAIAPDG